MPRASCSELLAWACPRLGLYAPGFRRVRGQVEKRIFRRMAELGLPDPAAYRRRLEADPAEWPVLDGLCRVTITRFFRDQAVFTALLEEHVPALAGAALTRGDRRFCILSAGCASGEEAYTVAAGWRVRLAPTVPLECRIRALDADPSLLARARAGLFPKSAFRELPEDLWPAFEVEGGSVRVPAELGRMIDFELADLRRELPGGPYDLAFCRNVAFTYFAPAEHQAMLDRLAAATHPGAVLVIGKKETAPEHPLWEPLPGPPGLYLRREPVAPAVPPPAP